jgi:hypothetical protein
LGRGGGGGGEEQCGEGCGRERTCNERADGRQNLEFHRYVNGRIGVDERQQKRPIRTRKGEADDASGMVLEGEPARGEEEAGPALQPSWKSRAMHTMAKRAMLMMEALGTMLCSPGRVIGSGERNL